MKLLEMTTLFPEFKVEEIKGTFYIKLEYNLDQDKFVQGNDAIAITIEKNQLEMCYINYLYSDYFKPYVKDKSSICKKFSGEKQVITEFNKLLEKERDHWLAIKEVKMELRRELVDQQIRNAWKPHYYY